MPRSRCWTLTTLDRFAFAQGHLIKIDVEGMELAVPEGAKLTIERAAVAGFPFAAVIARRGQDDPIRLPNRSHQFVLGAGVETAHAGTAWLWACHGPSGQPLGMTAFAGSQALDGADGTYGVGCGCSSGRFQMVCHDGVPVTDDGDPLQL